jgi:hypothetical protein
MAHTSPHAEAACSDADMGSALHVPYLPPEVHLIIARHIDLADLPNYRLVSKSCAQIGAPELFREIAFHCSSASMARAEAINACEHLHKHVNTLVWDTNMWSIPNVRDYHEWVRYFKEKAALRILRNWDWMLEPDQMLEIAHSHSEWEHYLDCVQDETAAKHWRHLEAFFGGFKSLYKLRVLNGAITTTSCGIHKTDVYVPKSEAPLAYYRGESLYNHDAISLQRPGAWAFSVFERFESIAWRLTKLRMDGVHWEVFSITSRAIGKVPSLEQVLSFHLKITFENEPIRYCHGQNVDYPIAAARFAFDQHLMEFLVKLPKLQSLKLELARSTYLCKKTLDLAPAVLHDIFSEDHIWTDLRKLSLSDIDTTCEALLSLLERHRSTLKILKLHNIWFERHDSDPLASQAELILELPQLVVRMKEVLDFEKAKWSGWLGLTLDSAGDEIENVGWNLEDDVNVPSVAEYLVKGGVCPLNETNMCGRLGTESDTKGLIWED